jgi:uroporphyrinogen decarboxylase
MTGKERIEAALRMEEPDRVPVFPIAHYYTAGLKPVPVSLFARDAGAMAECLAAGVDRFDWDGINPGDDVCVEGEAMGSRLSYPDDAPPYLVEPVLRDPSRLAELPSPDPLRDGRMPVVVGATALCAKQLGGRVFIGPFTMGPFNCASQVRGVEDLLTDILDRPEFVESLLDFCTGVLIRFGKALIDAGADAVFLGEALCSPAMISPAWYAKTVVPRQRRLVSALKAHAPVKVGLHICGDVRKILPAMLETGADILDLDWKVDMGEAKRICSGRAAIRGNLDPAAVLLQGTPDLVFRKSVEVIHAAGRGGGLILGSGCDVAPGTPQANLDAMLAAALAPGQSPPLEGMSPLI